MPCAQALIRSERQMTSHLHLRAGYDLHIIHVQPVHPNMMRHADETYQEAGLEQFDHKKGDGKASEHVSTYAAFPCCLW